MKHLSLYRLYRPQKFSEVVGQEHIVQTLQNAIRLDRITHAYLFYGPRGTGKTTMARLLAKGLNCENGPTDDPCDKCSRCKQIKAGNFLDLIEIDAASNRGIEEIRDLREKILFTPVEGNYRIYIIDEVHMLTEPAFNALLKTLEEPPSHSIIIMATTEYHKIPATITSRCQRFEFRRLSPELIAERLESVCSEEKIKLKNDVAMFLANAAEGSLRDALSLLEQIASFSQKEITVNDVYQVLGIPERESLEKILNSLLQQDMNECLKIIKSFEAEGKDFTQITKALIEIFKDLLITKLTQNVYKTKIVKTNIPNIAKAKILQIINILTKAYENMRYEAQKKLFLEVALISIASLLSDDEQINAESNLQIKKEVPMPEVKSSTQNYHLLNKENKIPSPQEDKSTTLKKQTLPTDNLSKVDLSLEKIKVLWKDFLLFTKEKKGIPITTLLNNGQLTNFANNILSIKFHPFDYNRMKEQYANLTKELLKEFFKQEISLHILSSEEINIVTEKNEDKQKIIKNALELFPGSTIKK